MIGCVNLQFVLKRNQPLPAASTSLICFAFHLFYFLERSQLPFNAVWFVESLLKECVQVFYFSHQEIVNTDTEVIFVADKLQKSKLYKIQKSYCIKFKLSN